MKTILLIGSPNSGKTTLFNRLTGLRSRAVNYPGSTVDLHSGPWREFQLIDTPGVYSLSPRSPDEEITLKALEAKNPDTVIAVVDATQLSRQLAIVVSLKRLFAKKSVLGEASSQSVPRLLVAVTMLDLLRLEGQSLDLKKLSEELGLLVIEVGTDVEDLLYQAVSLEAISHNSSSGIPMTGSGAPQGNDLREAKRIKDIVVHQASPKFLPDGNSRKNPPGPRESTRRMDRFALHPVLGPILFFIIMAGLFTLIYWLAQPLMEFVDNGFSLASEGFSSWTSQFSVSPVVQLASQLISDGLLSGLGAVMVFVPQIFILFCGLIFLEDSGYLARAASIVDRPLKAVGLGGRSFVPLLSGFACAVPAMMAARTISSRRERMLTLLILPLMSCSARLPVYALLLGLLFGDRALAAGLGLAALSLGSVVVGVLAARVLGTIAEKHGLFGKETSFLILELPLYRRPKLNLVIKQALLRTKSYIKKTGPVILVLSVLIWIGTTFPHFNEQDQAVRLESSYAGVVGKVVSPIFEPMGGDWRTGLGLISAFAAREVFVSTLAVIFHATESEDGVDGSGETGLLRSLSEAKAPDGQPLFTVASTLGLMIFFMIALQCLATFAVAVREANSWKFAVAQLIIFNVAAYVLTVALVQGLRALGVA